MRLVPLRGPTFGTYAPDEVGWLLQDLGDRVQLVSVEQREGALQSGASHYSETLPVEYRPSPRYRRVYEDLLRQWAPAVAVAVASLGRLLLERRGPDLVLVSLARAGTPVGALLRRWLGRQGVDAPHLTVSIIRDKGLDATAVWWLAAHHGLDKVVFVDGWTGKGVIAGELATSVARLGELGLVGLDPALAVLADPAGVTNLCATRDDILVPSACLNATVTGLVSRTVHSDRLVAVGEFHGARWYPELVADDVSASFLDAVERHFPTLAPLPTPGPATGEGRRAATQLAAKWGVHDLNLVKPGVGEATRVLLRRTPERVVVRSTADPGVAHLLVLAAEKGVSVVTDSSLPYAAVGLIRSMG